MKIFGIPLKIEPFFFIIAFFLGTASGASLALIFGWMVVVLFSVLLHELGHALTAKAFKLEPSIVLSGMGGLTYWNPLQSHPVPPAPDHTGGSVCRFFLWTDHLPCWTTQS